MLYVLIGVGNVGRALLTDVLEIDPASTFLVIDADANALKAARESAPTDRVRTQQAEATDEKSLAPLLRGAAVVINCTYGARCMEILNAAILARVPYIDIHGTLLLQERFARDEAARAAGITALVGMGVSPGLTNMLAAYGARKFSGPVDIDCEYVTHRPLNPTTGLLETALRQFRNGVGAPVYENGKTILHPPFSGAITTRFHGVDEEVELVYTPHSEPLTVPRFVKNARRVVVRGAYHRSIMNLLKSLHEFGLLDPKLHIRIDGRDVDFQPLLRDALMGNGEPRPAGLTALYCMRVRVTQGDQTIETTIGHPPGWEKIPQGRMTALPTAYSAPLIAHGKFVHHGVCGPELFSDAQVEGCLDHLRSHGLGIHYS